MRILDEEQNAKILPFSKGEEKFSLLFSEKKFHLTFSKSCIYELNLRTNLCLFLTKAQIIKSKHQLFNLHTLWDSVRISCLFYLEF